MTFEKNKIRAKRVLDALRPAYPKIDNKSIIKDAITDLMHASDMLSLDFDSLIIDAIDCYTIETQSPRMESEI